MSIIDRARELRQMIEKNSAAMTNAEALNHTELLPRWTGESKDYAIGDRVLYGGKVYSVLQKHASQEFWTPEDAPSLFAEVLIPDENIIPEWAQPESTNPYKNGDQVTHNDKTWISTVDNNVWEPGVYGWEEVNE